MHDLRVDALVPAHNEAAMIAQTIRSIALQSFVRHVHVTVHILANGCTDDTAAVATRTILELPFNSNIAFKVTELPIGNKIKALNYGLADSKAPIVFCIDSDALLSPDNFETTLALLDDPTVLVAGPLSQAIIAPENRHRLLGQLQMITNICSRLYERQAPDGCMLGFRRGLIDAYPTNIVADDTWLKLTVAQRYGWNAIRVARSSIITVVAPTQWLDYLKQESRFDRCTEQLLEAFPEYEKVYQEIQDQIEQLADEYRSRVGVELESAHISPTVYECRKLFRSMCLENAKLMANELVNANLRWEPVGTTKELAVTVVDSAATRQLLLA